MSYEPGRTVALLIACVLLSLAGCGSKYELAPVSGVVRIDGQPYPGGKVVFYPVATGGSDIAGRPSFGKMDGEGRFELSCYKQSDGAIVGEHTVTLFRAENHEEIRPDLKQLQFSRVNLPGGKVTVNPGDNEIDLELTSEEIAKFGNRI